MSKKKPTKNPPIVSPTVDAHAAATQPSLTVPPFAAADPVAVVKERLAAQRQIGDDVSALCAKYGIDAVRANLPLDATGSPPPIDFSFIMITPNDARALLGDNNIKNLHNRKLSGTAVTRYASDIGADQWALTHQAIAVGPDGDIVDGQHRLEAIIKAGKPVTMVLAIYRYASMAATARLNVDLGRARRGGDIVEISQVADKGMGTRIFAVTCAMMGLSESRPWGNWTAAAVTARYERERVGIDFAAGLPQKGFSAPIAGAFAFAHPVNPAKVAEFATTVREKVGICSNSAAYHYVNGQSSGFLSPATREKAGERTDIAHRVTRLLMAHIEGETFGKLQTSTKGTDYFAAKRRALGLV